MNRFRALLEYDGSEFAGWQKQLDHRTVQGCLEDTVLRITGAPAQVVGAGRTDAGVHATGQVAHFDSGTERSAAQLMRALNAVLPRDVAVLDLAQVAGHFHARYSAVARTYRYRLLVDRLRSPTRRRHTWHVGPIDTAPMRTAAGSLVGIRDFASLGRPPNPGGSTVREVRSIVIQDDGAVVDVVVEANAYLRHQVRRMTGLLVDVGRGRRTAEDVFGLMEGEVIAPVRRAPPQGLFLEAVAYPENPAQWRTSSGSKDVDSENE